MNRRILTNTERWIIAFFILVLVVGFFLKQCGVVFNEPRTPEEIRQDVMGD